jgi:hypothetical protein
VAVQNTAHCVANRLVKIVSFHQDREESRDGSLLEMSRPFEDLGQQREHGRRVAFLAGRLFELREGTVLRTNHPAGAPAALQVGGVELAAADIIVVDDSLSIRITRLSDNLKGSSGGNGSN